MKKLRLRQVIWLAQVSPDGKWQSHNSDAGVLIPIPGPFQQLGLWLSIGPAAPDYATWRTVKHSVLPGQLAAPLAALTASPPKKNVVLLRRKKKLINIVKERSASAPIKYVPIGVK